MNLVDEVLHIATNGNPEKLDSPYTITQSDWFRLVAIAAELKEQENCVGTYCKGVRWSEVEHTHPQLLAWGKGVQEQGSWGYSE